MCSNIKIDTNMFLSVSMYEQFRRIFYNSNIVLMTFLFLFLFYFLPPLPQICLNQKKFPLTFHYYQVKVLCSAAAPLKKLFLPAVTSPVYYEDENRALMDDLNITKGSVSVIFLTQNLF